MKRALRSHLCAGRLALVPLLSLGLQGCPATERAANKSPADARPEPAPPRCEQAPRRLAPTDPPPIDPVAALAALEEGIAFSRASAWSEAEGAYRAALGHDPGLGLAHLGLADALAYTGGSPEARQRHLAHAIVDLPRNPQAHAKFADAVLATEEPELALRHLRCALDLKPSLRDARRRASHLALDLESPDAAMALAQPLLSAEAEASDHLLASRIHSAAGALREASRAMEAAARRAKSANLYRRAAALWKASGDLEAEEKALDVAEALDPQKKRKLRPLRPSRRRR